VGTTILTLAQNGLPQYPALQARPVQEQGFAVLLFQLAVMNAPPLAKNNVLTTLITKDAETMMLILA